MITVIKPDRDVDEFVLWTSDYAGAPVYVGNREGTGTRLLTSYKRTPHVTAGMLELADRFGHSDAARAPGWPGLCWVYNGLWQVRHAKVAELARAVLQHGSTRGLVERIPTVELPAEGSLVTTRQFVGVSDPIPLTAPPAVVTNATCQAHQRMLLHWAKSPDRDDWCPADVVAIDVSDEHDDLKSRSLYVMRVWATGRRVLHTLEPGT